MGPPSTAPVQVEIERRLPSHPSSAGEARRMVMRALAEAGREDLEDVARLLVSEVVTNALVYAATPIDLSVTVSDDGLRVAVGDGSRHLPALRSYAATAQTGRGLSLLDQAADAWGVVPSLRGKTVWFQLSSGDGVDTAGDRGTPDLEAAGDPGATVDVELRNVPLLLHAAWRQHAEAMLREYLLTSLDHDLDDDPLSVHAAATDAVALLAEHIPHPPPASEADALVRGAADPQMSAARVVLPVGAGSAEHFDMLNSTLETAIVLAEAGQFLNAPVQPELRSLRRWFCAEVARQLGGASPQAWSTDQPTNGDGPSLPLRSVPSWDTAQVALSSQAIVAADDTNRVIAVSGPALDLLGYVDAGELVGERVVAIIPPRYRQAHLAGFTMYLLTGGGPLLGETVRVPVLRADGSEVTVGLLVEAHQVSEGRCVFTATLTDADESRTR